MEVEEEDEGKDTVTILVDGMKESARMLGESVSGLDELSKELDELEAMWEEIENDVKMVWPSETKAGPSWCESAGQD